MMIKVIHKGKQSMSQFYRWCMSNGSFNDMKAFFRQKNSFHLLDQLVATSPEGKFSLCLSNLQCYSHFSQFE